MVFVWLSVFGPSRFSIPHVDDNYALICRAIAERKQVHALFDGRPRAFCPHVIGAWAGQPRVLGFQFDGYSSSGLPPEGDWRCLQLDRFSEVELREGPWRTRPHSLPQSCIDEVDVSIVG